MRKLCHNLKLFLHQIAPQLTHGLSLPGGDVQEQVIELKKKKPTDTSLQVQESKSQMSALFWRRLPIILPLARSSEIVYHSRNLSTPDSATPGLTPFSIPLYFTIYEIFSRACRWRKANQSIYTMEHVHMIYTQPNGTS